MLQNGFLMHCLLCISTASSKNLCGCTKSIDQINGTGTHGLIGEETREGPKESLKKRLMLLPPPGCPSKEKVKGRPAKVPPRIMAVLRQRPCS
jgi:hypothetical protein